MRIDLHTHSRRSDGTDSPTELVDAAVAADLDVVALTDHDSAAGWAEANRAVAGTDLVLVTGIEVSCRYAGAGVHLLAYGPDPTYPPLVRELDRILAGRTGRLPETLERLRGLGIAISAEDVHAVAGDAAATGRPHVADAMIRLGVVSNRDEAFDRYLMPGRPAYVDRYAAGLVETIELVTAAGGVSVVAHPWSRGSRRRLSVEVFEELAEAGMAGIEAGHQDHSPADRAELTEIAQGAGLVWTGSSDYHGTGKLDHELGCQLTEPEQLSGLLERLEQAAGSVRTTGLQPPTVPAVPGLP